MTVIFIANTPFHAYICNTALGHFTSYHEKILITSKAFPAENGFSHVIKIRSGIISKVIDTYKSKKLLRRKVKENQNTHILIPHIISVLGNYVYSKHKSQFSFYYEGLLNFYICSFKYNWRDTLKISLFSYLIGFKFDFRADVFPIEEDNHRYFYTILPEETLGTSEKKIEILINTYKISEQRSNNLLILGGEPPSLDSKGLNKHYSTIKNLIDSDYQNYNIYYKFHPNESRIYYNKYFTTSRSLTKDLPVEELIDRINPEIIISFHSSAIITIKIMSPKTKIIVFYDKNSIFSKNDLTKVFEVYEKLGVELRTT